MLKSSPMAVLIGALFALMPCGAATPVLTTLYSFPAGTEGAFPEAGLVANSSGQLFGTTYSGGTGWGTVFQLIPPATQGNPWTIHQLYSFTGLADGANPRGALVFSSHGVIYGTTEQGGASGYGTVFSLTPAGGGKWTEATVYSFKGAPSGCVPGGSPACDGANPEAGLIFSPKGVIYGTTESGGTTSNGTVFSLTPGTGGTYTEAVLYSFAGAPSGCGTTGNPACDGANPLGSLTFSKTGTLYGTTYSGGTANWGTVFQLAQTSGVWTETVLWSFLGAPSGIGSSPPATCGTTGQPPCDGGAPAGNVVLNTTTGALFGTTTLGGRPTGCPQGGYEQGCGAVFELVPPATLGNPWTESLLYSFAGSTAACVSGGSPACDGANPSGNLAMPSSTSPIYGSAFAGGSPTDICFPASYYGCGIVFTLQPPKAPSTKWTKSSLAFFNGDGEICSNNATNIGCGGGPNGVILSTAGGILYGTTYVGGDGGGYGTVFEVTF
jgi:uncharacterized repeat protein (TIGR03803 family)